MPCDIRKLPTDWSIAILGGGSATRLESLLHGSSKWLISLEGRTVRERQLDVLAPLATDILWAGGRQHDPACALLENQPIRFVPDILPIAGPLAGIHTALVHAQHEKVLVVPCDAPTLIPELLLHLLHLATRHPHIPAIVPQHADGYWMPLVAVYRKACIPVIEALAKDGVAQVWRLFERLEHGATPPMAVDTTLLQAFDPSLASFININTDDDLAAFSREAQCNLPSLKNRSKRW